MYSAIRANKRNTVIIMAVFLLLIGGIGALVGYLGKDQNIAIWIIGIALVYAVVEYFVASRLAVAASGAKEIKKSDSPDLWNVVDNLAIASGQPMPRVFIIEDASPNAFATGRTPEHSYVVVTSGLLKELDKRELTGVMAHEMSHIANYDIRVSMIVFGLVSAIGLISDILLRTAFGVGRSDDDDSGSPYVYIVMIVVAILSPIIAAMIQLAVSRQREYLADSSAALLTRDPEGLIMALQKLDQSAKPLQRQNTATAHMYIVNPLKKGLLNRLFSTHPSINDRIARLKKIGGQM